MSRRRSVWIAAAIAAVAAVVGFVLPATADVGGTAEIRGRVLGTGGVALANVQVDAFEFDGTTWQNITADWTNSTGYFRITSLSAGTYRICYNLDNHYSWGSHPEYLSECYNNVVNGVEDSTDIVVADAAIVTGRGATLAPAALATGTITGPTSRSVLVQALDESGAVLSETYSDPSTGTYRLGGLQSGAYKVSFNRASDITRYAAQFFNNKAESLGLGAGNIVNFTEGTTVSGVNAALVTGGSIVGYTKTGSGVGVANCLVLALTDDDHLITRAAFSNSAGKFNIGGLTTGSYKLVIAPFSCDAAGAATVDRWGDAQSATRLNTSHAAADNIPVTQGSVRQIGTVVVGP